ncbi:MAG: hypothetical protein SPLUMA2_SPLUMAMAG2_01782 [uncultured Sulfurimonas sp.]|nr:MAG: hypothetical protein SPLUMA2_SPLUMAMAG2_01782 [uncultured Sulfurimonas sp.]
MFSYIKKIKYFIESVVYQYYYKYLKKLDTQKSFKVSWDSQYDNFGDIVTPYILENLTDTKIEKIGKSQYFPYQHYFVIGSILDRATSHTIVWGSGFISEDAKPLSLPKKILAVRGPKTRNRFLEMGVDCPEVYGDPALLLSKIYYPKVDKKYKLGIIPHYTDKNHSWLEKISHDEDILIIDIQVKDPRIFIKELLSCEKIASSSLHGIITADSYSIPSVWLEFSNKVKGKGFKFHDYFLSVNRTIEKPLFINQETMTTEIYEVFSPYTIDIDLDKLLAVCPFELK